MRRLAAAAGILLAAGTPAVLGTGSAQAATTTDTIPIGGSVVLGALHLSKADANNNLTTVNLNCYRVRGLDGQLYVTGSGAVPDARAACQELDAVGGDGTKLDEHPTWLINELFDPVTVRETGFWDGAWVDYTSTYTNSSDLAKHTGDVFAF